MSGPRPNAEYEIARYRKAYRDANGSDLPLRAAYIKGWVELRSANSSWVVQRKRLSELRAMADRLIARSVQPSPTPLAAGENAEGADA